MRSLPYYQIVVLGFLLLAVRHSVAAELPFADNYADSIEALLRDHFADANSGMVIGLIDEHGRRVWLTLCLRAGSRYPNYDRLL